MGTGNTKKAEVGDWIIIPESENRFWCGTYRVISWDVFDNNKMIVIQHPTKGYGGFYPDSYTIDPICESKLWQILK